MSGEYATLERPEGDACIRFVRTLAHPRALAWRALAEPAGMSTWFPARMEGERRAGAPLRFVFAEAPGHDTRGVLLAWEPPRLLEIAWEGDRLRAELRDDGDGCELTFSASFPEVGKAARDAAGWHVCLDNLERHLDGRAPTPADQQPWRPLMTQYAERFGPEAATIGPPDWHPESGSAG